MPIVRILARTLIDCPGIDEGIGSVLPKLHAIVDDLNAMALKVDVTCRHRPMSEQLACTPNGTFLSFRGHQNNAVLHVKMSVNADMAKLVNLGAGMDLARGEKVDQLNNLVTFRAKYGCLGT